MLKQDDLVSSKEMITIEQRRCFLRLPLDERRRILAEQAESAAHPYESEQKVRNAKLAAW